MKKNLNILLISAGASALASVASAAFSFDDFSYGTGGLETQNGGSGWDGAWDNVAGIGVDGTTNLTSSFYSVTQTGSGRLLPEGTSGTLVGRNLGSAITGTSGGTEVWFSMLIQSDGQGRMGLYFNNTTTNRNSADAGFLVVGTTFRELQDGTLAGSGPSVGTTGTTHLILGQIDLLDTGSSTINYWFNPADLNNLGAPNESSLANFEGTISKASVELYSGSGTILTSYIDALYISDGGGNATTAFQDVTGVPEPGSFAMISGICALGFIFLRRRRLR